MTPNKKKKIIEMYFAYKRNNKTSNPKKVIPIFPIATYRKRWKLLTGRKNIQIKKKRKVFHSKINVFKEFPICTPNFFFYVLSTIFIFIAYHLPIPSCCKLLLFNLNAWILLLKGICTVPYLPITLILVCINRYLVKVYFCWCKQK